MATGFGIYSGAPEYLVDVSCKAFISMILQRLHDTNPKKQKSTSYATLVGHAFYPITLRIRLIIVYHKIMFIKSNGPPFANRACFLGVGDRSSTLLRNHYSTIRGIKYSDTVGI